MNTCNIDDHRVNVRLPLDLYDDLKRLAKEGGWDVSKQIRFELLSLRGLSSGPSLPGRKPRRVA